MRAAFPTRSKEIGMKVAKRKICTFCGKLVSIKETIKDPMYGTTICKDRKQCLINLGFRSSKE
jgi:hypothetical protein